MLTFYKLDSPSCSRSRQNSHCCAHPSQCAHCSCLTASRLVVECIPLPGEWFAVSLVVCFGIFLAGRTEAWRNRRLAPGRIFVAREVDRRRWFPACWSKLGTGRSREVLTSWKTFLDKVFALNGVMTKDGGRLSFAPFSMHVTGEDWVNRISPTLGYRCPTCKKGFRCVLDASNLGTR